MLDLVGAAEIAQMLDVSRQRVQQLTAKPHFPPPEAELAMGKVWLRTSIEQWARDRGRVVRGDRTATI